MTGKERITEKEREEAWSFFAAVGAMALLFGWLMAIHMLTWAGIVFLVLAAITAKGVRAVLPGIGVALMLGWLTTASPAILFWIGVVFLVLGLVVWGTTKGKK